MTKINCALGVMALASLGFFSSCTGENQDQQTQDTETTPTQIVLEDFSSSPQYSEASLGLKNVSTTMVGTDSVKIEFDFDVKNYELGAQTADAATKGCSNSGQGQHIHFILDNSPYAALYKPTHSVVLPVNTEHTLLCFLSRSYHESIKDSAASMVMKFNVNDKGELETLPVPTEPLLFYSRPKGDYVGEDTANLMLDYYVVNATLGTDYKVKATITNSTTGNNFQTTLDSWKPMFIKNLGTGKCNVTLSLVDANGISVNPEKNKISRDFTMSQQEPLP